MSKQHQHVKTLRNHNRWRHGGDGEMTNPTALGIALDWAIAVCEAADNLVNVNGRHHAEKAYSRLENAVNPE